MDVEIVDDEMNRGGIRILLDQMVGDGRELRGRAVRRSEGKVSSCLGLHGTEHIGRAGALIFAVLPRLAGGSLQTMAMTRWRCLVSSRLCAPGRCLSYKAALQSGFLIAPSDFPD